MEKLKSQIKNESDGLFKVTRNEESGEIKIQCFEALYPKLRKPCGFKEQAAALKVFERTLDGLITGDLSSDKIELSIYQVLLEMGELKPRDGFEGMLISQMVTAYDQAMDCFKYANINKSNAHAVARLRRNACQLMQVYCQQLEALDKHRKCNPEPIEQERGADTIAQEKHK